MRDKLYERLFQFNMNPGTHEKIREIARSRRETMAEIIREAIDEYLEKEKDHGNSQVNTNAAN